MYVERESFWYKVLVARYTARAVEGRREGHVSVANDLFVVRRGIGLGVGNWFDDNMRRMAGDGVYLFLTHI